MDTERASQEYRNAAILKFVERSTFFLVPGKQSDPVASGSSAVPVLTPAGHVALVTAWHVARGAQDTPHRLGGPSCGLGVQDVVRGILPGPARLRGGDAPAGCEESVDVALVLLSEAAQLAVRDSAVNLDAIALDDEIDPDNDLVVLSGYPFHWSEAPTRAPTSRRFSHMFYLTRSRGKDACGRLLLEWGAATVRPLGTPAPTAVSSEQPQNIGVPGGISGGAVWRFRRAQNDGLWSPASDGQIIGVPMAWDTVNTEIAESCCLWRDWLVESVTKIDEHYASGRGT